MRRWRTRALIGVKTDDRRIIIGSVRHDDEVALKDCRGALRHGGCRPVGLVRTRVVGNEIQALLPWRQRHANVDLWPRGNDACIIHSPDGLLEFVNPTVVGFTIMSAGLNPWDL